MILRRFTQHVNEQNWFAVALDVLVVVVGIFLGMQVTEWNEARKDRKDSHEFLERIHTEVLSSERASQRVLERRLNLIHDLTAAVRMTSDEQAGSTLTDRHCFALGTSHYYNISVTDLPSLVELMNAGRLTIIEDDQLRTALIELQQATGALRAVILDDNNAHNLPMLHPNIIALTSHFDGELGEIQSKYRCNLEAMRENRSFLNAASETLDSYDAYLRDGLRPWSENIITLHRLLDDVLGLHHDGKNQ